MLCVGQVCCIHAVCCTSAVCLVRASLGVGRGIHALCKCCAPPDVNRLVNSRTPLDGLNNFCLRHPHANRGQVHGAMYSMRQAGAVTYAEARDQRMRLVQGWV